jgi:hypothetical protein
MTVRSIDSPKKQVVRTQRTTIKHLGKPVRAYGYDFVHQAASSQGHLPAYISLPLIRHNPYWERVNCQRTPLVVLASSLERSGLKGPGTDSLAKSAAT